MHTFFAHWIVALSFINVFFSKDRLQLVFDLFQVVILVLLFIRYCLHKLTNL
jgi:hypothetical protein